VIIIFSPPGVDPVGFLFFGRGWGGFFLGEGLWRWRGGTLECGVLEMGSPGGRQGWDSGGRKGPLEMEGWGIREGLRRGRRLGPGRRGFSRRRDWRWRAMGRENLGGDEGIGREGDWEGGGWGASGWKEELGGGARGLEGRRFAGC